MLESDLFLGLNFNLLKIILQQIFSPRNTKMIKTNCEWIKN